MRSHVNPEESLGFALKRLQQTLRSRMDASLAPHGLTTPQYSVLALLAEHPGISNAELARRSFVAAPTMLRILDALGAAGLIVRSQPSASLRSRGTVLTEVGRARLEAASGSVQGYEDILVSHADDYDVVMAWLRSCAESLS